MRSFSFSDKIEANFREIISIYFFFACIRSKISRANFVASVFFESHVFFRKSKKAFGIVVSTCTCHVHPSVGLA